MVSIPNHGYVGLMGSLLSAAEAPQDDALILSDVVSCCLCSNPLGQGVRENHALKFGESKSEKLDHHHSQPSSFSFWAYILSALSWDLGHLATTGEKGTTSGIEQKYHQVSERFRSGEDGAWLLVVRDGQVAYWQCWAPRSM